MNGAGGDDVVIPWWLRVGGTAIGLTVTAAAVISGLGHHPPTTAADARPRRPTPSVLGGPPSIAASAAPGATPTTTSPVSPSGPGPGAVGPLALPIPLAAGGFADPAAVAAAFAAAYLTWRAPDGPPSAAARVAPYITSALRARFPQPSSGQSAAPSAVAVVDAERVVSDSAATKVFEIAATRHLLGQNGTALAVASTASMAVAVDRQANGAWLVGSFSPPRD